jgi:hypothetical protein
MNRIVLLYFALLSIGYISFWIAFGYDEGMISRSILTEVCLWIFIVFQFPMTIFKDALGLNIGINPLLMFVIAFIWTILLHFCGLLFEKYLPSRHFFRNKMK